MQTGYLDRSYRVQNKNTFLIRMRMKYLFSEEDNKTYRQMAIEGPVINTTKIYRLGKGDMRIIFKTLNTPARSL